MGGLAAYFLTLEKGSAKSSETGPKVRYVGTREGAKAKSERFRIDAMHALDRLCNHSAVRQVGCRGATAESITSQSNLLHGVYSSTAYRVRLSLRLTHETSSHLEVVVHTPCERQPLKALHISCQLCERRKMEASFFLRVKLQRQAIRSLGHDDKDTATASVHEYGRLERSASKRVSSVLEVSAWMSRCLDPAVQEKLRATIIRSVAA